MIVSSSNITIKINIDITIISIISSSSSDNNISSSIIVIIVCGLHGSRRFCMLLYVSIHVYMFLYFCRRASQRALSTRGRVLRTLVL